MTIIGYARVSTTDQNLDIQTAALTAAGADIIITYAADQAIGWLKEG